MSCLAGLRERPEHDRERRPALPALPPCASPWPSSGPNVSGAARVAPRKPPSESPAIRVRRQASSPPARPTKPKATGSNPVGRAPLSPQGAGFIPLQSRLRGSGGSRAAAALRAWSGTFRELVVASWSHFGPIPAGRGRRLEPEAGADGPSGVVGVERADGRPGNWGDPPLPRPRGRREAMPRITGDPGDHAVWTSQLYGCIAISAGRGRKRVDRRPTRPAGRLRRRSGAAARARRAAPGGRATRRGSVR
jgi:hypothetical protein